MENQIEDARKEDIKLEFVIEEEEKRQSFK